MLGRLRAFALATPVGRAFACAVGGRERPALGLLGLVFSFALLTATVPLSLTMQRSVIACGHFRPRTLVSWVVLQPVPKMYVHENRVLVASRPPAGGALSGGSQGRFEVGAFFVNHYPARIARFDGKRREIFGPPPRARFLILRTRYRDTTITTEMVASVREGHLTLSPTEAQP